MSDALTGDEKIIFAEVGTVTLLTPALCIRAFVYFGRCLDFTAQF